MESNNQEGNGSVFCNQNAIRVLIHIKTKQFFPGIKYHEETLDHVAQQFRLRSTFQIHTLTEARLLQVAQAVVQFLPANACPPAYKPDG